MNFNFKDKQSVNEKQETNNHIEDDDEDSKDYVYVDDDFELEDVDESSASQSNSRSAFYKKHRVQNIRQKKVQKTLVKDGIMRPHSASHLTRTASNFVPTGIHSSSNNNIDLATNLTRSNTDLNTFNGHHHPTSKAGLNIFNKDKISRAQQKLQKQIDYDSENDQMPIKLGSDSDSNELEALHANARNKSSAVATASAIAAAAPSSGLRSLSSIGLMTTSVSKLPSAESGNATNRVSSSASLKCFSTHSLPRSRSRSRTPTASSSAASSSEFVASSNSYRSATVSSTNKSTNSLGSGEMVNVALAGANDTLINPHSSITSTSTQYHTISASLASNFIKSSLIGSGSGSKKKSSFY